MPKETIDPDSIIKYKNSQNQNISAHKQIQKKINDVASKINHDKFENFGEQLENKNTYFSNSKIPEENKKDLAELEEEANRNLRSSGLDKNTYTYCQKCPTMKNKCPHRTEKNQFKDKYTYPITSSSTYGWLEPIDTIIENRNIKSYIQGFYDKSHL